MAYDKGGGFIRCLTLFANVDPAFLSDASLNTKEEYQRHVRTLNNKLPTSILKSIRWNSDIHEMTQSLYEIEYKYDLKYDAIKL